jgi:hypothetical protein
LDALDTAVQVDFAPDFPYCFPVADVFEIAADVAPVFVYALSLSILLSLSPLLWFFHVRLNLLSH